MFVGGLWGWNSATNTNTQGSNLAQVSSRRRASEWEREKEISRKGLSESGELVPLRAPFFRIISQTISNIGHNSWGSIPKSSPGLEVETLGAEVFFSAFWDQNWRRGHATEYHSSHKKNICEQECAL